MDALYWRLVYPDDSYRDELAENSSILSAPTGAVELHGCVPVGAFGEFRKPVVRVDLRGGYRPVFYRVRTMELNDRSEWANPTYTVLGRGRDGDDRIDASLWQWCVGTTIDCPAHLIDGQMVSLQIDGVGDQQPKSRSIASA